VNLNVKINLSGFCFFISNIIFQILNIRYLPFLVLTWSIPYSAFAQPDTLWTKTFGGSVWDEGRSVRQTDDGGFIVTCCGSSFGAGERDVYLIKTDENGDTLWFRTFGGSYDDRGYCVRQTSEGGYIIAGFSESTGMGEDDIILIKTDESGGELWNSNYGLLYEDQGEYVEQTNDGGYIVTGSAYIDVYYSYDIVLLKTDAQGNTEWGHLIGGYYGDHAYCVQQTDDGGYILIGNCGSPGVNDYNVYVIKTDALGNEEWSREYGDVAHDYGNCIRQTADGGYIITGHLQNPATGNYNACLIKISAGGDSIWSHTYGGDGYDEGVSVWQTGDGGYIFCGRTESFGAGAADVYVVKTDSLGNELWRQTFGGAGDDRSYDMCLTSDGGYVITGLTTSYGAGNQDIWLIRLDSEPPPMITDLIISIEFTNIILNWSENPAAVSYNIYRSDTPYFDITGMTPVATVTESLYIDQNAVLQAGYFYKVTCVTP